MDIKAFLTRACALPGISGHEGAVADHIAGAFRPLSAEVTIDALFDVIARVGEKGPRIMVTAHHDEIGLMVLAIEKDGALRFTEVGGVDGRILPAMPVTVHTMAGALPGVIGAKPPHLLSGEDRKKAVRMKDLFIDLGMPPEEVRALVRPGDPVTLTGDLILLEEGRLAAKTLDDRACVACMLVAAQHLKEMRVDARVYFVSASQEETHSQGAIVTGCALDPDMAIAIDVAHGPAPGAAEDETCPLDIPTLTLGPFMHPVLTNRLRETAKQNGIPLTIEVSPGKTYTDADYTGISRAGVPSLLIGVPVKYMHTTVEMLSEQVIRDVGRLVALFIRDIGREWEAIQWN